MSSGVYPGNKGRIPWNKKYPDAFCTVCKIKLTDKKAKTCLEHRFTIETREKISKALIGRKLSPEHAEKSRIANLGKKASLETRFKLSRIKKERGIVPPHPKGKDHYRWIKDRSLLKDDSRERNGQLHREWSKAVKNRDSWKCCLSNNDCNGKIEAHHILSWASHPELRYDIKNGISLCHYHHPRKREEEIRLSPYFSKIIRNLKN